MRINHFIFQRICPEMKKKVYFEFVETKKI